MIALEPIDYSDLRPIRDIVYENLRSAIMKGQLKSGERLVENQLAEQLGVSRTPVREALRMLEQDGLAIALPRRGTVVAGLRREEAIEIYNIRGVLEGLVARLAAQYIYPEDIKQLREKLEKMRPNTKNVEGVLSVHAEYMSIIVSASRSPRIGQMLDNIFWQVRSLRGVSLTTPARQHQAWHEHIAIVDALEEHNPDKVEQIARQHVENAKIAFLAQLE
ncbi:MAG: GntR family transcriptional regulator [Bacillota bacterium]|nr:GntR family transcriptional regulator [Bacillota bacterium]